MSSLKKIFLLAAFSFTYLSFGQDADKMVNRGNAVISSNYCLVIDNTIPLQEYYVADASSLGWTSQAHAKKMCGHHSNNLVGYTPDYENNKMLIHIYVERTYEPRDFAWWKNYLMSICD